MRLELLHMCVHSTTLKTTHFYHWNKKYVGPYLLPEIHRDKN